MDVMKQEQWLMRETLKKPYVGPSQDPAWTQLGPKGTQDLTGLFPCFYTSSSFREIAMQM